MKMNAATARAGLRLALPLLVGLLVLALAALPLLSDGHPVGEWPLAAVITPERMLALIGLGILFGQFPPRFVPFAIGLMVASGLSAYIVREEIFKLLVTVPTAAPNAFFAAPAAGLAVGLVLVLPRKARPYLAPPLLALAGAALVVGTALDDPTLHALSYLPAALLFEVWTVFVVMGLVRAVSHPFAVTAGQILASWMIAISLLYGGVLVVDENRTQLTPLPFATPPAAGEHPGFAEILAVIDAEKGRVNP